MDEVREVLLATLEDVKTAEVPDALKVIAFSKVFDLRAGGPAAGGPPGGTATMQRQQAGSQTPADDGHQDGLASIATRVDTSRDTVADVFEIVDGAVQLIVPTGKLPAQIASATKEIALLIAGARQAAGLEEWTSWDHIREVCTEFKKFDSGNFAKSIRSMQDSFNYRKESERKTLVKLSRPGWETFGALVKRLGGDT